VSACQQPVAADGPPRGPPRNEALAIESAEIGASHRLPLADSIIYATALYCDAALWTLLRTSPQLGRAG
jgi:hypothetical protein